MRQPFLLISFALASIVFAACSATDDNNARSEDQVRPNADVIQLVFNVWTCKDLECLNLETAETTLHTYTACAAVMEDALTVGVSLCETRKRSSVVSSPASCEPTGQACPNAERGSAYNWDDALRKRHNDGGADGSADGGT